MQHDPEVASLVKELLKNYEDAKAEAERRMQQEMDRGDVKAAGIWLSVMYELARDASSSLTKIPKQ